MEAFILNNKDTSDPIRIDKRVKHVSMGKSRDNISDIFHLNIQLDFVTNESTQNLYEILRLTTSFVKR